MKKWTWRPKWLKLPETTGNGQKRADAVQATVSRLQSQDKLRKAMADRKVVQEVVKEARELNDKFGDAIEQAMRRVPNG